MKKYFVTSIFTCCLLASSLAQNTVAIPAGETIEIDYSDYANYTVLLSTIGMHEVYASVVSNSTGKLESRSGIPKVGKEEILIEQGSKLLLNNENEKDVKINYTINPYNKEINNLPRKYVEFTLSNSSNTSIPLIIPTVMNPNLSPNSKSAVTLKLGQEVYFKAKGKKQILLIVDQSIKNGDVLDVAKLLPRRKKELGL